jgi:N-acyl-D-amino-acid deacylase
MTSAVAERFSIRERGMIKPGYYADITVFDENKLRDGITDQEQSFGIEKVYINGISVLDGDVLDTEAIKHSGRAMRS